MSTERKHFKPPLCNGNLHFSWEIPCGNGVSLLGFKGGGLRHLTACKILKPPLYKLHLTPFPVRGISLFLSALLGNSISCAEGRQHDDAAAEGSVLVATLAVSRVRRRCRAILLGKEASPLIYSVAVVAAVLAVEHAALGETRHGHSEDDGEGDYLFFHRCICCLIVDC